MSYRTTTESDDLIDYDRANGRAALHAGSPNAEGLSRGRLMLMLQGALSAALLGYLFWNIDLRDALAAARGANMMLLCLALLQLSAQIFLAAARWEIVARSLGGDLPFGAAVRYTWIGTFFNQALPASVGGDALRMWLYWRHSRNRRVAVHSVVLERLVMVGSLLLLVLAVQPGLAGRGAPVAIVSTDAFVLGAMVIAVALLLAARPLLSNFPDYKILRVLNLIADDVRELLRSLPRSALVAVLSMAAQVNIAITAWLIAQALGLTVSFLDCLILFPVVVLAATLPISVGGWGIREGVTITLLALVGVSSAEALALSILLGIAGVVVSLPGSVLWLSGRSAAPRVESMMDEYTHAEDNDQIFASHSNQSMPGQS